MEDFFVMIRRIKMVLLGLVIIFLAVVVFQNQDFLVKQNNGMYINLGFKEIVIDETPMYVYFAVCFIIGFLCASYYTVGKHFQMRKQAKNYEEIIDNLNQELESKNKQAEEPEIKNDEIVEINAA